MTKKPTNTAASVKARLLNIARERGEDFNLLLIRFIQERLLYRLSKSKHAGDFVLKGAALFTVWGGEPHRPTKDIDLLAHGEASTDRLRQVFADICRVKVTDDGLLFEPESVTAEVIREDAIYDGVRLTISVRIGTGRTSIQVDVGFGDAVVPAPRKIEYPTFLEMPAPKLRAYAPETVVAEKLEAMVQLGMANSRMKDFYDIAYMSQTFDFDGPRLAKAVRATFGRRGTAIPTGTPLALTTEFAGDGA